jgi:S-adenosylmethionine hydrolase
MPIITLTTDFGTKDHFVGALKGAIYSEIDNIHIVDISHQITQFNIQECAYILKNAYRHYPKGSIHIVGVESEFTPENKHLVLQIDGHFFITANNGVMSLICDEIKADKVYELQLPNAVHNSFPSLNIFVKAACHIARGGTLDVIGKPFKELKELVDYKARISDDGKTIEGHVIYIDSYGNIVTNVKKHLFESYRNRRSFTINARHAKINKIHKNYSDPKIPEGKLLSIFNDSDYLEIAIYKSDRQSGGASSLLGLDYRDRITLVFD